MLSLLELVEVEDNHCPAWQLLWLISMYFNLRFLRAMAFQNGVMISRSDEPSVFHFIV